MKSYYEWPGHGISFPFWARPSILANHIDGPVLHFSDGQMHWLTIWQRIKFRFGWLDAESLQRQLRPEFSAWIDKKPVPSPVVLSPENGESHG